MRCAILVCSFLCLTGPAPAATVDDAIYERLQRTETIRVFVELASIDDLHHRVSRAGIDAIHVLQTIPAMIATVSNEGLAQLIADPAVLSVVADRQGSGGLNTSVAQIGANRVQQRGITGAGIVVAVLDSGIDAAHPDVDGAVVGEECFCVSGCCPGGSARASGLGSAAGLHPHGVHVAGIIASRGHVAPRGVAPGAGIVAVRVLDDDNRGFLSDWLAGLDWVLASRPDVRVVNMSLVSDALFTAPCDAADAFTRGFAQVVEQLRLRGTVVVSIAGNNASTTMLTAPGCIAQVTTAGAVDSGDLVAEFSNGGNGVDLLAPGISIVSDAPNGVIGVLSGTSMAGAHVSGALALLAEAQPGANAPSLETVLRTTGTPVRDPRTGRFLHRIDVFAALRTISRDAELLRGGGSRATDCLLEWSVVPPNIARDGRVAVVECVDNDPLCDFDFDVGQCTFLLSVCFNQNDPLLPDCSLHETITGFDLTSPSGEAPAGSRERINADNLLQSLPGVPLPDTNVCGVPFPFVVPTTGVSALRAAATTRTRRDYDRIVLRCSAGKR